MEADVISRVRSGDSEAFAALVRAHGPVATRVAVLRGAGSDADDVVQEAFVKAYLALDGFRAGEPFRPWLLRIVVRECSNRRRGAGRRAEREGRAARLDLDAPAGHDPALRLELTERQRWLYDAVTGLPAGYRDVVVCRYLLELSEAETALTLQIAAGTVKSRLSRGLRALREELADGAPA